MPTSILITWGIATLSAFFLIQRILSMITALAQYLPPFLRSSYRSSLVGLLVISIIQVVGSIWLDGLAPLTLAWFFMLLAVLFAWGAGSLLKLGLFIFGPLLVILTLVMIWLSTLFYGGVCWDLGLDKAN